jgi:hypothetical protein
MTLHGQRDDVARWARHPCWLFRKLLMQCDSDRYPARAQTNGNARRWLA